jgi:hypothetical protein
VMDLNSLVQDEDLCDAEPAASAPAVVKRDAEAVMDEMDTPALSARQANRLKRKAKQQGKGGKRTCGAGTGVVSSLGDAKSSLGDAKSSLGDAKSSLGDAKSSLGDAKLSLGDAKSSLGDAKSSLGDIQAASAAAAGDGDASAAAAEDDDAEVNLPSASLSSRNHTRLVRSVASAVAG